MEVDALSRIDWDWKLTSETVRVILAITVDGHSTLAKICAHTITVVPSFQVASCIARVEQMQDQDLSQVICLYNTRQLDKAKLCYFKSREVKALLHLWVKLKLWEGVLYLKTSPNQEDQNDMRLIPPWAYHSLAMHGHHYDLGHLGNECMIDLLHDQFYWSMMQDDVDQHIWDCGRCN